MEFDSRHDQQQEFGECDVEGDPVFVDLDGTKFYGAVKVHNLCVKIGDAVRVKLESGDNDDEDEPGFAQVLAIYDDDRVDGEGVHIEVRWYMQPEELPAKRKKIFASLDNELIESDLLDDIPAGSIADHICIRQVNEKGQKAAVAKAEASFSALDASESHFVCRYLSAQASTSFQYVSQLTALQRGMAMSSYKHAYVEHLKVNTSRSGSGGGGGASRGVQPKVGDVYSNAIRKLHVSVVPDILPCRTEERGKIHDILRKAISTQCADKTPPLYISGMPGTGKTATLKACVRSLEKEAEAGTLPAFQFVEINCLKLQSPADAYTFLWREMDGGHLSAKSAKLRLTEYFEQGPQRGSDRRTVICLVDELDYLVARDEEVVYNFLNWPLMPGSSLVVVGIANVMDLPERLSPRVTSRLGITMERMIFMAYSYQQIREILEGRLSDLSLKIFDNSSLELVSRKAATVAGDLRAALKICQRTIELYRDQQTVTAKGASNGSSSGGGNHGSGTGSSTGSSSCGGAAADDKKTMMALVKIAADEYRESPLLATITRACLLDKSILVVMWRHFKSSGQQEMTLDVIWHRLEDLLLTARANPRMTLQKPPLVVFVEAIERMVEQGILKRAGLKAAASLVGAARAGFVSMRSEMTDVIAALTSTPDSAGENPLKEYV